MKTSEIFGRSENIYLKQGADRVSVADIRYKASTADAPKANLITEWRFRFGIASIWALECQRRAYLLFLAKEIRQKLPIRSGV